MDKALRRYEAGEISKIQVLYTHYKNTLTCVPTLMTILPVEPKAMKTGGADTIYEPSQAVMTDKVIPMAAKSLLYSLYLESKTSEQASRRMAMESATDNATELQEELELEYNRIRQGAIAGDHGNRQRRQRACVRRSTNGCNQYWKSITGYGTCCGCQVRAESSA